MEFSATGNLLTGRSSSPKFITIIPCDGKSYRRKTKINKLDLLGAFPIISSFTGFGRTLLGIAHTIVHLSCAIFLKNRKYHLNETKIGIKNAGIGLLTMIPIIGNIAAYLLNSKSLKKHIEKIDETVMVDSNQRPIQFKKEFIGHTLLFYNNTLYAQCLSEKFQNECKKLKPNHSLKDERNIILNIRG